MSLNLWRAFPSPIASYSGSRGRGRKSPVHANMCVIYPDFSGYWMFSAHSQHTIMSQSICMYIRMNVLMLVLLAGVMSSGMGVDWYISYALENVGLLVRCTERWADSMHYVHKGCFSVATNWVWHVMKCYHLSSTTTLAWTTVLWQ